MVIHNLPKNRILRRDNYKSIGILWCNCNSKITITRCWDSVIFCDGCIVEILYLELRHNNYDYEVREGSKYSLGGIAESHRSICDIANVLPLYPEILILKIFTGSAAYCICSMIGSDISDKNHADPNSLEPILDSDRVPHSIGFSVTFIIFVSFFAFLLLMATNRSITTFCVSFSNNIYISRSIFGVNISLRSTSLSANDCMNVVVLFVHSTTSVVSVAENDLTISP